RVDEVTVALDESRQGEGALTVGVISDIQTTNIDAHERRAAERVVEAGPDLILVTGDLCQGTPSQFAANRAALRALLGMTEAPAGTFLVPGDTDSVDELRDLGAGTPVR